MTEFFRGFLIPALIFVVIACLVGVVLWRSGLARRFWESSFWDDVAPDTDADDDPHALYAVAAEIPADELERFAAADMVCFAVREVSYFGTRFFWVHEYETGRLQLQALAIALGFTPQDFLPIFGRSAASEHVNEDYIQWDDLGGIPLKLGNTGRYNEAPFRLLANLIGKDISVQSQPQPLSHVKQAPTPLFTVSYKETAVVGG